VGRKARLFLFFNAEERQGKRRGSLRAIVYNWSNLVNHWDEVMQEISSQRDVLIAQILPIVEKLFQDNNLYQLKLDKQEMIEMLVNMFGQFTPEEMKAITEPDLTRRIDKILVLEAVSGTLNDLTPEQIKMYDEAVKRK
jgi:hypothetical protein